MPVYICKIIDLIKEILILQLFVYVFKKQLSEYISSTWIAKDMENLLVISRVVLNYVKISQLCYRDNYLKFTEKLQKFRAQLTFSINFHIIVITVKLYEWSEL